MNIDKIPAGKNPPQDVNVVIEITGGASGGAPVKYEIDKESGAIFVDRFLHTAMFYPGNYGFIPHTLADDGDPMDIIVVGPTPVVPGAIIRARPVGALIMRDEAGGDDKILCIPSKDPRNAHIQDLTDVSDFDRLEIQHFFETYKDLEPGKSVEGAHWAGKAEAEAEVERSIARLATHGHGAPAVEQPASAANPRRTRGVF